MATIEGNPAQIATGLTGNTSSDLATRTFQPFGALGGGLVITSTVGATPTVTVNIQGSFDGTTFFNVPYALVATPRTFVITAITITTAVSTTYILQEGIPYRFLKIVTSANTNVTLDAKAYL